ncbi:MAG: glycoside hydrolase family 9 protein [Bacteroidales bacterium]|nr:glycoside hydrolase family 9 protein [Bacteroidales bacterium]
MKTASGIIGLSLSMVCSLMIVNGQHLSEDIRLNQLGFYPNAPKKVVIFNHEADRFYITTPNLSDTLYSGNLKGPFSSSFNPKPTRIADFSDFKKEGTFVVCIPGLGYSYQFDIKANVHNNVAAASLKSYYFQRASTSLPYEYAGIWARPAGHPDNKLMIHASAASEKRPEGTIISTPRGWYDAGDYNKYIINSGITMGNLLSVYEDYPSFFKNISLNIPESNNNIPDLLDEILWNLRWMITMQDPNDGGVYFKCTDPGFDGMIMPAEANQQRYVVQKSTTSALDFTAVMAQASRIFKAFEKDLPGLSDSCLLAAKNAWEWALKNPDIEYNQREMNRQYDPDIHTGSYGDRDFSDEWIWAASELTISTGEKEYFKRINIVPDDSLSIPFWGHVKLMGYFSLVRHQENISKIAGEDIHKIKELIVKFADRLIEGVDQHYYNTAMGKSKEDFTWGSNDKATSQGIVLLYAYRITRNKKYMDIALANLDYILGRNATGYSFITGYGDKYPMNIHHRPTAGDGLREPVPGFVAGGPNFRKEDRLEYPTESPDECYLDVTASFASNENCINWNSSFAYLAYAFEAMQEELGYAEK